MVFWWIWLIGIVITFCTRMAVNNFVRDSYFYENNILVRSILNILVAICFFTVGGILVGKWVGNFAKINWTIPKVIFVTIPTIIGTLVTYFAGYFILGLYHFPKKSRKIFIVFVFVFIVSIIFWSIPICKYNQNIEITKQNVVKSQEERKLLYFCNIPVQEVSGEISRSFFTTSGEITTANNLTYWYLNENGEGIFDSAETKVSKIIFIDDNQSPHVEIVEYSTQEVSKNNNNGKQKITTIKNWKEYNFYLPENIMEYNLK